EARLLAAAEAPIGRASARAEPEEVAELVDRQGVGVQRGDVAEQLAGSDAGPGAAVLQHHADPGSELGVVALRIEAEDAHRPGGGPPKPLADLDGGGLARSVRPEDRGHRPSLDRQAEPVDSRPRPIPNHQVGYLDG